MKKLQPLSYLASLVLVIFFLGSCTKSEVDDSSSLTSKQLVQDKELLTSLGYDSSDLIRRDTCYIVEGDICITDRHLNNIRNNTKTRHTYNSEMHFTVEENYRNIKVNIALSNGSAAQQIAREALQYWNEKSKCGIHFQEGSPADVTISYNNDIEPEDGPEVATPPVGDGKPGPSIVLYPNHTLLFGASYEQYKYTIVHALGHVVGFGHTPKNSSEYLGAGHNNIPDTPTWDAKSIMVRPSGALNWTGISRADTLAFQKTYPYTPDPEPEPKLYLTYTPNEAFRKNIWYTFKARYENDPNCTDPQYEFTVSSAAHRTNISNGEIEVLFPENGTYEVKVSVSNASSPIETTCGNIKIYDNAPTLSISPNESIEIGKTYRLNISYDNPIEGSAPQYNFTAKNNTFETKKATLTPVSGNGKACDIVFTHPGKYEINAALKSNSNIKANLIASVYSQEIAITQSASSILSDCNFSAFYYSAEHPAPQFNFSIVNPPGHYTIKNIEANNIDIMFYEEGEYTLRVEIEGTPEIYKEHTFFVNPLLGLRGLTITPNGPIEIGTRYRLNVPDDISYNPGENPQYRFTVTDHLFNNIPILRTVDNRTCDVIFTKPGEYEIKAWLDSNNTHVGPITRTVYSREIAIDQYPTIIVGPSKGTYSFEANYYSNIHPDPSFKFTIIAPPADPGPWKPMAYYEVDLIGKNHITYRFYTAGEYTLRAEVEGAPEIYVEQPFSVTTLSDLPLEPTGPILRP